MRTLTTAIVLTWLMASPAIAQDTIAPRSTIYDAVAAAPSVDAANRQLVMKALHQPGVRELAEGMGVNLIEAERAMATMSTDQLNELAKPAQAIIDKTGGDRTITISLTTLLLGIIVLLLIAD